MTLTVALAGSLKLRVQIYDDEGEPSEDGWTLVESRPEWDALNRTWRWQDREVDPGPEMTRWIDSEFARWGIEAFGLRALYELNRAEEGDDYAA